MLISEGTSQSGMGFLLMRNSQDMESGGISTNRPKFVIMVCLLLGITIFDVVLKLVANSDRDTMRVGDCFTIEPSLVQGSNSRGFQWDDGWTMATEVSFHILQQVLQERELIDVQSGGRSAQQEHQILITESGAEVLTRRIGEQT